MAFDTSFESVSYQSLTDVSLIMGTCELSDIGDFGTIDSCNLVRIGDTRDIKDCRNRTRAFLIDNAGFELDLDCIFDNSISIYEMGSLITFPLLEIQGIIMPGTTIKWTKGGERMMSIKAKSWDHLSNTAQIWAYSPSTGLYVNPD